MTKRKPTKPQRPPKGTPTPAAALAREKPPPLGDVERTAVISDDELYRYRLGRRWDAGPTIAWVMLNPSTADATQDDRTILTITDFSRRWGFGALTVVNLYAWRSKDPDVLADVIDPIGPENIDHLHDVIGAAYTTVAAWGSWWRQCTEKRRPHRIDVEAIARQRRRRLYCLAVTQHGEPRHPLYIARTTPLIPWSDPA